MWMAGMRTPRTWASTRASSVLAIAVAAGLLGQIAMPLSAADAPTDWEPVLKLQLQDNNSCRLEKVLFVREMQLGGETGLEGRIRCIDGREYDFTRQRRHEKFDIRLCQPTVC